MSKLHTWVQAVVAHRDQHHPAYPTKDWIYDDNDGDSSGTSDAMLVVIPFKNR